MGDLISNVLEAIDEWFRGLLADGIISSLTTVNDLLASAFNGTSTDAGGDTTVGTTVSGIFKEYLGNVMEFGSTEQTDPSGHITYAGSLWGPLELLLDNAIVPIAEIILALVMCYELYDIVVNSNNFHEVDTSLFIKWVIKCLCGIIILDNVYSIASWFLQLGTDATSDIMSLISGGSFLSSGMATSITSDTFRNTLMSYDVGTLLITLVISFLTIIGAFIVLAAILVVLCQRVIEAMMYLSIAPIPAATMLNREWGEMGKNWLRSILAIGFQGFFIVIALYIFRSLLSSAVGGITSGEGLVLKMCTMFGYLIALIFTIMRTSQISKSAFGAH